MNHRSKLLALTTVAAVAGLAVFVSSGIGGDGSAPTADSIDLSVTEPKTISADELKLVDTGRMPLRGAGASASRKSAKLFYFVSEATLSVAPKTADLREIRCPPKQLPVGGGVFAPAPGLAITNSSRTNPIPGGPTLPGAWYEQVTNLTDDVTLTWRVHLTCIGK
jgi:hypothetical protein